MVEHLGRLPGEVLAQAGDAVRAAVTTGMAPALRQSLRLWKRRLRKRELQLKLPGKSSSRPAHRTSIPARTWSNRFQRAATGSTRRCA